MSLDHLSPEARVALAGIAPLREPETGAEALMMTNRPEDARRVLARGVARLARLRDEAAELMEHMLGQLDMIDGDPDLEPSLCATVGATHCYPDNYATGYAGDLFSDRLYVPELGRSDEVDLEEDAGDDGEAGNPDDEDDGNGEDADPGEDDGLLEPSLGSLEGAQYIEVTARRADGSASRTRLSHPLDQTRWAQGDNHDLEEQCDDEGNDGGDREWDPCDYGEPENEE